FEQAVICSRLLLMDCELPDVFPASAESTPTKTRKRKRAGVSVGRKEEKILEPESLLEGANAEYTVEDVKNFEWTDKRLRFTVKWKFYPDSCNSIEKLCNLVSLQIPFKYMTEENPNYETKCFSIFTGLHKVGYRYHTSDDRFHFCVMREKLIKASFNDPYMHFFESDYDREEQLTCYNTRLQRVDGSFMFKVENQIDWAMPSPFFGINIQEEENDQVDQLPSFSPRQEMTIVRINSTWCLRTESNLDEGKSLFHFHGNVCSASTAHSHLVEWGELVAFSHFVYIGMDEKGEEWALDRRGVFDAASCLAHCCVPNCKIVVNIDLKRVDVITIRDIEKGEELTLDYFYEEREKRSKDDVADILNTERDVIECTCRSSNCRSILWLEKQADDIFYEYNKEDKLGRMGSGIFKGIQFNTK
ncbi:hypothetical protein PFISCL1PPCAC_10638, partial [Pristionchus fissidentatus]